MSKEKQIAKAKVAETMITKDQMAIITKTIAAGATPDELKLYLYDCQRRGVHPLDRMIHFTKRGGRYTPIAGIDYLRSRADATGEHAGTDDALINYPDDGDKKYPESATVRVWKLITIGQNNDKKEKVAYVATARWKEFYPGEELGFMWRKMPTAMLSKCAEAAALRKAFPQQLSGLFTTEELDQSNAREADVLPPASDIVEDIKAEGMKLK